MTRAAVSVRLIAGAPVALVDHARAERPGLDQVERDVFGDRRQERRAATDRDVLWSVPSNAAATSSTTDASASRAFPWTLSSVRLKTTFGTDGRIDARSARRLVARTRAGGPARCPRCPVRTG